MTPSEYKDTSTIVSIVPIEIREFKPGIYPGNFNIPACEDQRKPVVFYVNGSMHVVTVANQRDPLMVETASYRIAEAIVNDYITAQIATSPTAKPGLTFFPGKISKEDLFFDGMSLEPTDIRFTYRKRLEELRTAQKNWFDNLFRMADNDWNRYKHHRAISDLARIGAKVYGIANKKEWMVEGNIEQVLIDCPRCYGKVDARASICLHCSHILNENKDRTFRVKEKVIA